jgi:NADP-dependent 3-hydroxyisobutyrate dehydrogenase-like protein
MSASKTSVTALSDRVRRLAHFIATLCVEAPRSSQVGSSPISAPSSRRSAAAAELLTAGTAMGLDPRQVFAILVRFAPGLSARERGFLHHEHEPTMFAVRDLVKDLNLGVHAFDETGTSTPLTHLARARYEETMRGSADLDISAVIESWSGNDVLAS